LQPRPGFGARTQLNWTRRVDDRKISSKKWQLLSSAIKIAQLPGFLNIIISGGVVDFSFHNASAAKRASILGIKSAMARSFSPLFA
jgi:hypothetical protein